jgi:hypothetical protein
MNQPVTQIETTKVLADPPRKPKQKAATAIVRDLGSKLEISRSLSESNQIVGSPPPGLVDSDVVKVLK